jgi:hypothetical protein
MHADAPVSMQIFSTSVAKDTLLLAGVVERLNKSP